MKHQQQNFQGGDGRERFGTGVFLFVYEFNNEGRVKPGFEMHHWVDDDYTTLDKLAALELFRQSFNVPDAHSFTFHEF